MNRNMWLAGAALALLGTVAIAQLFGSKSGSSDWPDLAVVHATPDPADAAVVRDSPEAIPPDPAAAEPPSTSGSTASNAGTEPTHQEIRDRVLAPSDMERRDRAREQHHERIAEGARVRFLAFADKVGLDAELREQAADKLVDHLHNSHATREAVRTGELDREEAKVELAIAKEQLKQDMVAILGEDGYEAMRQSVPGKW